MSNIPHGGKLVNNIAENSRREEILSNASKYKKLTVSDRHVSDCEMIANGAFSPLTGFMGKEDAESVIKDMHLSLGELWTIPIVLPIPSEKWDSLEENDDIMLYDSNEREIALLNVSEKFKLDLEEYVNHVYGTPSIEHPGVKLVLDDGKYFIAGSIELVNRPIRENIDDSFFLDPIHTRALIDERGWKTVAAFQTRNPIHRAHEYLIRCAAEVTDGVLIHPLVGFTKPVDIPAPVRMNCYTTVVDHYFYPQHVALSVFPAAMRYAGPREAIHHAICRKNYGVTHMIVGRDHAGVGDFYGTYDAQNLVFKLKDELGVEPLKFMHAFYCKDCSAYGTEKTCPHDSDSHVHLSGTKVRAMLRNGERPPKEFSRPKIADILIEWAVKNNGSE